MRPSAGVSPPPPPRCDGAIDRHAWSRTRLRRDGLIGDFDVDVSDSTELPLAQCPHFNVGLSFAAAMQTLERASSEPDVCAIVITETDPDNDATGACLRRLAEGLAWSIGRVRSGGRLD